MQQILSFDKPIPSCFIQNVEFHNDKMVYNYLIDTEVELNENMEEDLAIYNQISYLRLVKLSSLNPISVNIPISSLSEYISYLNKQREADLALRRNYREKNPNAIILTKTILQKRNYSREELSEMGIEYIIEILQEKEDFIEVSYWG